MSVPDLSATNGDVYVAGVLAATLERTGDGVRFAYLPEYVEDDGAPVATTLPVTADALLTPSGALPPFFTGLLPEGRRLSGLRRAVKTSLDDELSLLLAVGADPVGNVQIVPAGTAPNRTDALVQVESSWTEVVFSELMDAAEVVDPVALPGVQDKASARMISVPVARAGLRYILKVSPPEFPLVVENEAYFIALARQAGLATVRAEIVHDAAGRSGLLVERFDRVPIDGDTVCLAAEDAAQVLGIYPADKYAVTTERVCTALADRCSARPVALRDLVRQVCFAWFTGNGDLHAKNLSILSTPAGEWRVSPAYDLPSTVPYGDRTMALSIGGSKTGLSRRALLAFAGDLGLPARAAERVLDQALTATARTPDDIARGAIPLDRNALRAWTKELRHRRRLAE